VHAVRAHAAREPAFASTVFVHPSKPASAEAFFAKAWPGAASVADPQGRLFDAFDFRRARLRQLFGARVLGAALRALRAGHGIGRPAGDVWRKPGALVLSRAGVHFEHRPEHIGELPDFEVLARALSAPGPGAEAP
jgi:hypothetical protein